MTEGTRRRLVHGPPRTHITEDALEKIQEKYLGETEVTITEKKRDA